MTEAETRIEVQKKHPPPMLEMLYRRSRTALKGLVEGSQEYGRLQAAMRDLIRTAASGRSPRSLLDVGCGAGGYSLGYAEAACVPPERVCGVDADGTYIDSACRRFVAHVVDLESERLPVDDGSMDFVVCNQVLEHLKDIFWVLAEMDRVLAVGGVLAIGVPNLTSLINRPVLLLGRQPITIAIEGPHVRGFAHHSFRRFLERHPGYRLVAERGSSLYPWPARLGAERLARRLPSLSAYALYALVKEAAVVPCPWRTVSSSGETTYRPAGGVEA